MKRLLFLTIVLVSLADIHAQKHGAGLVMDWKALEKIPKKAPLLTREYTSFPKSYSLKKYCPIPGDQSSYGTCTGWATAYAGRTIVEAIQNGWTDKQKITSEAFAPLYIYYMIKDKNVKGCLEGTSIERALSVMKEKGVVKKRSLDALCVETVKSSLATEALRYRIDDYFTLFGQQHKQDEVIRVTKKALVENCPVLVGMNIYTSLSYAREYWDGKHDESRGNHAMCVVGYDDTKYGGSFEIMNSWGESWGNNGFIWVPYKTFSENAGWALELYMKPKSAPVEKKEQKTVETNSFAGNLSMKLSTGQTLKTTLGTKNGFKYYKVTQSLTSGTRYRIYVGNNQPGYVYVFSADEQKNVAVNFPTNGLSAALTYKTNTIALPNENMWLELDDTRGTDYLCILFSKYSVDTNSLLNHLKTGRGNNFYEKVQNGFSKYLVPQSQIKFSSSTMSFTASSDKAMVPLFVEFTHK